MFKQLLAASSVLVLLTAMGAVSAQETTTTEEAPATEQMPATEEMPMIDEDVPTAAASLVNQAGEAVGTATFLDTPHGVIIRIQAEGLPAGEMGVHIHETGACDPATKFESAGGHFNPTDAEHGFLNENGPHAGDMPNQFVGENGTLDVNLINPMVSLSQVTGDEANEGTEALPTLLDDDGAAIMIHAHADDYKSQPTGEAGDRLACGVIEISPP